MCFWKFFEFRLDFAPGYSLSHYSWQSSEYIWRSKYVRILIMAGLWICKSYSGLNMTQTSSFCLNRTGNRLNMFKFIIIIDRVLSVSHTIHRTSSLYNPFPVESLKKYKIKTNPNMGILIYFKIQDVQPIITRNAFKKWNFRFIY